MEATKHTLFGKIAAVMGEVRTLEKTGRNQYDKYDYVTADAIATKIGTALARHKVAFLPAIIGVETAEYTTQKGGSNFRTVVNMHMVFADGDTGETWVSSWSGEAIDRSDKSISKAAVSAVKYYLIKTFLLAGGDEEDADAHSPVVVTAPPQDNPFDDVDFGDAKPSAKQPDTLSAAQKSRLHALGTQCYGDKWDAERKRLVLHVTKGAVESSNDLTKDEAQILIAGIEKKLAEQAPKTNGVAHANGTAQ